MSGQLMAVNGPLARSVRDARLALSAMAVLDAGEIVEAHAGTCIPIDPRD